MRGESKMFEDIENLVEGGVKKVVTEFEKKPISTTVKGLVVLWVLKKVVTWFKTK